MKPLTIFYLIVGYVFAQFCWWAFLLVELQPEKWIMIVGEGAVFLSLLLFAAYRMRKAIGDEVALQNRHKNFLLSVTHEFKSPLAAIKLYLETLEKRDLDKAQQKKFISNSIQDIDRLDDLVENMLIATRIDSKNYSFPKEDFNFSELILAIINRYKNHASKSRTIETCLENDIILNGDRFAMCSVVSNLIENAMKYSPEASTLAVRLMKLKNHIIFEVADQGDGITDPEKLKIFNKFYRIGNENTRKTKGTGLGLFIVKEVLQNQQASIKVLNNEPKGTIFRTVFEDKNLSLI